LKSKSTKSELELNDVEGFIRAHTWKFAKTMPWAPHEYVYKTAAIDAELFDQVKIFIHENGVPEWYHWSQYGKSGKKERKYFYHEDHIYWCMPHNIFDPQYPNLKIINRALLSDYPERDPLTEDEIKGIKSLIVLDNPQ